MKKEKTMNELVKEFPDKSYRELEIYRDADRNEEAAKIPLTESQKSQEDLEPITKGVCVTGALRRDREPRSNLDRLEKENNDCYNRIAEALEVNESHQKLNGKLQERLTELEEENKKLHNTLNKKMDDVRKAGL